MCGNALGTALGCQAWRGAQVARGMSAMQLGLVCVWTGGLSPQCAGMLGCAGPTGHTQLLEIEPVPVHTACGHKCPRAPPCRAAGRRQCESKGPFAWRCVRAGVRGSGCSRFPPWSWARVHAPFGAHSCRIGLWHLALGIGAGASAEQSPELCCRDVVCDVRRACGRVGLGLASCLGSNAGRCHCRCGMQCWHATSGRHLSLHQDGGGCHW